MIEQQFNQTVNNSTSENQLLKGSINHEFHITKPQGLHNARIIHGSMVTKQQVIVSKQGSDALEGAQTRKKLLRGSKIDAPVIINSPREEIFPDYDQLDKTSQKVDVINNDQSLPFQVNSRSILQSSSQQNLTKIKKGLHENKQESKNSIESSNKLKKKMLAVEDIKREPPAAKDTSGKVEAEKRSWRLKSIYIIVLIDLINDRAAMCASDEELISKGIRSQQTLNLESQHNGFLGINTKRCKIFKKKLKNCLNLKRSNFSQKFLNISSHYLCQRRVLGCFSKFILKSKPLFEAHSIFSRIWKCFIVLLTIILIVLIPFDFCFNIQWEWWQIAVNTVIPWLFGLDILKKLNTELVYQDTLANQRKLIILDYIRKRLFNDIIIMLGLTNPFCQSNGEEKLMRFLFLIRVISINQFFSKLRRYLIADNRKKAIIDILILFFRIIYIYHVMACAWFFIGHYQLNKGEPSWLAKYNLFDLQHSQQHESIIFNTCTVDNQYQIYIYSFYESIKILCLSLGSQLVAQETQLEITFKIVLILISIGILAYILQEIQSICNKSRLDKEIFNKNLEGLQRYFNKHQVDQILRRRAIRQLEHSHQESLSLIHGHQKNLNILEKYLKEQIIGAVNARILKGIGILSKNFSEAFLMKLAIHMREQIYQQGEMILMQNTIEEPTFSIITHGQVEIYVQMGSQLQAYQQKKNIKGFQTLGANDYFGQQEFFQENYYTKMSIRANSLTSILRISLGVFKELLNDFPQDREVFCTLRDRLVINKDYAALALHCYSCQRQKQHEALECPYLFYTKNMLAVLEQQKKEFKEMKKHFKRSKKRRVFRGLSSIRFQQDRLLEFQQYESELIQDYLYEILHQQSSESSSDSPRSMEMIDTYSQHNIDQVFENDSCHRQKQFQQERKAVASPDQLSLSFENDVNQIKMDQEMTKNLNVVQSLIQKYKSPNNSKLQSSKTKTFKLGNDLEQYSSDLDLPCKKPRSNSFHLIEQPKISEQIRPGHQKSVGNMPNQVSGKLDLTNQKKQEAEVNQMPQPSQISFNLEEELNITPQISDSLANQTINQQLQLMENYSIMDEAVGKSKLSEDSNQLVESKSNNTQQISVNEQQLGSRQQQLQQTSFSISNDEPHKIEQFNTKVNNSYRRQLPNIQNQLNPTPRWSSNLGEAVDYLEDPLQQSHKVKIFEIYSPKNNVDQVIQNFNKQQKTIQKKNKRSNPLISQVLLKVSNQNY